MIGNSDIIRFAASLSIFQTASDSFWVSTAACVPQGTHAVAVLVGRILEADCF